MNKAFSEIERKSNSRFSKYEPSLPQSSCKLYKKNGTKKEQTFNLYNIL